MNGRALNGTTPLPYAEIVIYGEGNFNTYIYTVSDANGYYTINIPVDPVKQFKLNIYY